MNRLLAALMVAVFLLVACSVPTDEQATPLDPESLPDALTPGFTATTTTGAEPTDEAPVTIFLLMDRPDRPSAAVIPVPRDFELEPSLEDVLRTLFEVDVAAAEEGLVSELAAGVYRLVSASTDGDLATIDIVSIDSVTGELAEDQTIPREILQNIAAQLVWTATEFSPDIVLVKIEVNGADISIPTPEGQTEEGDPVERADYAIYALDFPFEVEDPPDTSSTDSTTATATTTSTSAPEG